MSGPRLKKALLDLAYPAFAVLLVLIAWEMWIWLGDVPAYRFPSASDVAVAMVKERSTLLPEALLTLRVILLGYGLAILLALPLAVGIVTWRPFERSVYPLIVATQVTPLIAVAPMIIVVLGFGLTSKLLIVFLTAFFPIVINTVAGLRSLQTEKRHLGTSMGASRLQFFLKIRLPDALPNVFTGLELAAAFAVVGAVIAEFVGSVDGLGHLLIVASGGFDTLLLCAGVGYLTVMGIALFYLVVLAKRLLTPWHVAHHPSFRGTL
ncbi:MAG: NitT/TauT family transport system permease protein [Thermoleophilaceae bacterium]|jgi:NitT/TauT family transport system permease protein|nr:NitT/TauT family transport system permease protein [Thermoleophilaceae bacterium]